MNLDEDQALAMDDNGRIIRKDAFKGFTPAQQRKILAENEALKQIKYMSAEQQASYERYLRNLILFLCPHFVVSMQSTSEITSNCPLYGTSICPLDGTGIGRCSSSFPLEPWRRPNWKSRVCARQREIDIWRFSRSRGNMARREGLRRW